MEKDMIIPSALALSKLRYEAKKCDWTTARQHPKMEKLHSDSSHWRETLFQTDHSGNCRAPERACDDLQPAVAAISLSSAKSNTHGWELAIGRLVVICHQ